MFLVYSGFVFSYFRLFVVYSPFRLFVIAIQAKLLRELQLSPAVSAIQDWKRHTRTQKCPKGVLRTCCSNLLCILDFGMSGE